MNHPVDRPRPRLWTAVEALLWLLLWQCLIRVMNFDRIATHLKKAARQPPEPATANTDRAARRVRWAIAATSRRLPWRVTCLPQALAAAGMLRRRGVANTLYIGAQPASDRPFRGHAWVMAGDICVTGGRESVNLPVFTHYPS